MRIAVCYDDECEINHLSELTTEYQLSRGVSPKCHFFCNSIDFLCDIKGGEYDLVVLDAVMPGASGIKVAREFAVESYSVDAYHYLLKPIDMDALFPLLDIVKKELSIQEEQGFVLKSREGVVRLSFAEIEFVEVINKKVTIHLTDGEMCRDEERA